MKFYGSADMQQNELRDAVIPLDTAFPVTTKVGHVVFKDRILYICVEIVASTPVWVPLTNEITAYTHYQNTDASSWVINHPLNTADVNVMVYDTSSRVVIPNEITVNSRSQVTVDFSVITQGKVVLVSGQFDGQSKPSYAYEHYQTTPSTSWVVTHGLGRYPVIRVFVGNQEVQPLSITFDSTNQVTITFSTTLAGQAKLI